MFKRTRISAGLLLAFGGAVASTGALAQQVLERVEITGSSIKRVDAEGPSPVDIVTREQIERTGATSINELLRSIAAVDIFDQGELASNSPSGSGTASVRLRGLSETDVLVLLNRDGQSAPQQGQAVPQQARQPASTGSQIPR